MSYVWPRIIVNENEALTFSTWKDLPWVSVTASLQRLALSLTALVTCSNVRLSNMLTHRQESSKTKVSFFLTLEEWLWIRDSLEIREHFGCWIWLRQEMNTPPSFLYPIIVYWTPLKKDVRYAEKKPHYKESVVKGSLYQSFEYSSASWW